MRDKSIDIGRGLMVLMMVYGHFLQFFEDLSRYPCDPIIVDVFSYMVFPVFVFCFGATAVLAYLRKPYQKALPGMIQTFFRTYLVYFISGVAFRVLMEDQYLSLGTIVPIFLLQRVPGFSECLLAFALYILLLIVLFKQLDWLSYRPKTALIISVLCLLACFLPHEKITSPHLSLFVGGAGFTYYPIVQHMPLFLAGMIYARSDGKLRMKMLILSIICGAISLGYMILTNEAATRFPPSWTRILLSTTGISLIMLIAKGTAKLEERKPGRFIVWLNNMLSHFGARSLYYLLLSNLTFFAIAGKGLHPKFFTSGFLRTLTSAGSPLGAIFWATAMLLGLWFITGLAGRGQSRSKPKATK